MGADHLIALAVVAAPGAPERRKRRDVESRGGDYRAEDEDDDENDDERTTRFGARPGLRRALRSAPRSENQSVLDEVGGGRGCRRTYRPAPPPGHSVPDPLT